MYVKHGISEKLKQELEKISHTIIKKNYFPFQNTLYIQEEGLMMGAPTLSIFSEIYLQHIENTDILDILVKYLIVGYFQYVDDIIVQNKTTTNIFEVFNIFNNLTPTMKFTIEEEIDNDNILDITTLKEAENLSFDIYRKPTKTDTIIPNDSCHPLEHKLAALSYLANRMET